MPPRKMSDETEAETEAREKKVKKIKKEDYCPPSCFTLSQAESINSLSALPESKLVPVTVAR